MDTSGRPTRLASLVFFLHSGHRSRVLEKELVSFDCASIGMFGASTYRLIRDIEQHKPG